MELRAWHAVWVLQRPPRTPAQFPFPGAGGIVFNFPRLCRRRRGMARSLSPGITQFRRKCRPGLWPRQTFSRRNFRSRTETGSECLQRRVRVLNAWASSSARRSRGATLRTECSRFWAFSGGTTQTRLGRRTSFSSGQASDDLVLPARQGLAVFLPHCSRLACDTRVVSAGQVAQQSGITP
jgi:hypothetical protein